MTVILNVNGLPEADKNHASFPGVISSKAQTYHTWGSYMLYLSAAGETSYQHLGGLLHPMHFQSFFFFEKNLLGVSSSHLLIRHEFGHMYFAIKDNSQVVP